MTIVKTTAELQQALAAGTDPQTIQIAAPEQVDTAAVKSEAAKAERDRINGINALAVKGFESEISAAIENGSSIEATALALFKAAQDRGISIDGIKSDAQGVKTAVTKTADEKVQAERKSAVAAIVAGANAR